jgi:AcrR family transcriptional regulator
MVGRTAVKPGTPRLRADATRNRERIVAAAQQAYTESGSDVPLYEIARRAGLGNATVYRHFTDRRQLMRSVVLAVLDRMADEAETMIAHNPRPRPPRRGWRAGGIRGRGCRRAASAAHRTGRRPVRPHS